jgi:hypothetical protein
VRLSIVAAVYKDKDDGLLDCCSVCALCNARQLIAAATDGSPDDVRALKIHTQPLWSVEKAAFVS